MKTLEIAEKTDINHDKLIGTKWVAWSEYISSQMSVEFVDSRKCVYTSQPQKFPLTYNIADGELFISNIEGPFELRGSVLYNNDIPTFEMAA